MDKTSRLKKLSELLLEVKFEDLTTKNDRNTFLTLKAKKEKLEDELGYKELVG